MSVLILAGVLLWARNTHSALIQPQKAIARQAGLDWIDPSCRILDMQSKGSGKRGTKWAGSIAEWNSLPWCKSSQVGGAALGGRW